MKRLRETAKDLIDNYFKLSSHAYDFTKTAEFYAKIIISEKHLPLESKTIHPISVGGIGM